MDVSMFIISIVIGFLLGIISGMVPGIHTNTFAFILAACAPWFVGIGFSSIDIAVIIISNAITHTFINIIPSVFLGAPDADTSLAVLPGHRMLLDGYGSQAVRLSALGSAGSVLVSLILIIPMSVFFSNMYPLVDRYIGWILLLIVLMLIYTEQGEVVEGQGSLVRMKFRAYAVMLFIISGLLGLFALRSESLIDPVIQFGKPSILMPLFCGLFGASMLVISMQTNAVVPKQTDSSVLLSRRRILRGMFIGSTAGSLVAWLPGITAAVATVLARLCVRENGSNDDSVKEFIISISGVNTANAILGLIALYVINRARSGAMVAVSNVFGDITLDIDVLVQLLIVITMVSIAAYFSTIWLGNRILPLLTRINYQKLCGLILSGLTILVLIFTGWFGLIIFAASTQIGMLAPYLKIRRSHAMGVLLLPLMMYYL